MDCFRQSSALTCLSVSIYSSIDIWERKDGRAVILYTNSSYPSCHRRICRSLIPMISAACHHVIFFAIARKITSCIFIARSTAAYV